MKLNRDKNRKNYYADLVLTLSTLYALHCHFFIFAAVAQTYHGSFEGGRGYCSLVGDFFPSILLVTLCVAEAPGVHPIRGLSPRTPWQWHQRLPWGSAFSLRYFTDICRIKKIAQNKTCIPYLEMGGFPWGGEPLSPGACRCCGPL